MHDNNKENFLMRNERCFLTSFLPILKKSFKLETTCFQVFIAIIVCKFILIMHKYKKNNYDDK